MGLSLMRHVRRRALGASMGLVLSSLVLGSLVLSSLACSTVAPRSPDAPPPATPPPPAATPERPATPAPLGAASWPARSELFLASSEDGELMLRAWHDDQVTSFRHTLARDVGPVVVVPELRLVWYSVGDQLWVLDMRALDAESEPVLVAEEVPPHGALQLIRARPGAKPERYGDLDADLVFHWENESWLEAGNGEDGMERAGRAASPDWLSRELPRVAQPVLALDFGSDRGRVKLPEPWTACADRDVCGLSLPFGPRGWQLVVSQEDEPGDVAHYRCVLHDPASNRFASPVEGATAGARWAALPDVSAGSCGAYLFDATAASFLTGETVCRIGGSCAPIAATAHGWVESGPRVGSP